MDDHEFSSKGSVGISTHTHECDDTSGYCVHMI